MTAPTEMVPALADDEFVGAFRGDLIDAYHPLRRGADGLQRA